VRWQGVAHIGGRAFDRVVIAIREDLPAAPAQAIEGAGDAHQQAGHALVELRGAVGLDDEMEVIALQGEMADAKAPPLAGRREGAADDPIDLVGAQVADLAGKARGDVKGQALFHIGAAPVHDAHRAPGLGTAGAGALAAVEGAAAVGDEIGVRQAGLDGAAASSSAAWGTLAVWGDLRLARRLGLRRGPSRRGRGVGAAASHADA